MDFAHLPVVRRIRYVNLACLARLTVQVNSSIVIDIMKAREIRQELMSRGCTETMTKGSHRRYENPTCPDRTCKTTVPFHKGEDVKKGTVKGIEDDMEHCFGAGWLRGNR